MQTLLITDLDNTLYNWIDFFAPSFRAMVHVLARAMKVSEDVLIESFRDVYTKRGSLEYSFSIQELDIIKNYSEEEILKILELGQKVFSIVRRKNLKPYEGVKETLEQLYQGGVLIVGVTNAPLYHAKMRLMQLKIDRYFYGLGGWEGNIMPQDQYTKEIVNKEKTGKYKTKIGKSWAFSKEEMKPNPFAYLHIISQLMVSHRKTYVLGDSLSKDILPAKKIGAIGIWAKYGTEYDKKNFETLLKITHWDKNKINEVYNDSSVDPDYIINSFSELKNIIELPQRSLF
jgi:FMN phosphatase YigB (HAD superfamily)